MNLALGLMMGTGASSAYPLWSLFPATPSLIVDPTRDWHELNGTRYGSITSIPGWSFSRASAKWSRTAAGVWTQYASGVVALNDAGLDVEGAGTNLCTYSHTTSNAGWTTFACSKTAGQTDPFGLNDFALVTGDGTSGNHSFQPPNVSYTSGTTYTSSVIVKAGTADRLQLTLPSANFSGLGYANFYLSGAGSVSATGGTLTGSGIQSLGSGWYRIWITAAATATSAGAACNIAILVTGSETRIPTTSAATNYTVGAAQVEASVYPTSPIVTDASTATRAADAAYIDGLSLAYPQSAYVEFVRRADLGASQRILALSDGTSNNRFLFDVSPSDKAGAGSWSGGVNDGSSYDTSNNVVDAIAKLAGRCGSNDLRVCSNGVLATQDSSVTVPAANVSRVDFGQNQASGGSHLYGALRTVILFPVAASDASMQALTA